MQSPRPGTSLARGESPFEGCGGNSRTRGLLRALRRNLGTISHSRCFWEIVSSLMLPPIDEASLMGVSFGFLGGLRRRCPSLLLLPCPTFIILFWKIVFWSVMKILHFADWAVEYNRSNSIHLRNSDICLSSWNNKLYFVTIYFIRKNTFNNKKYIEG